MKNWILAMLMLMVMRQTWDIEEGRDVKYIGVAKEWSWDYKTIPEDLKY